MNVIPVFRPYQVALTCALVVIASLATAADPPGGAYSSYNYVPKQVHLVADGDKLFASNVKFNRFDELKLSAQERVLDQQVGAARGVAEQRAHVGSRRGIDLAALGRRSHAPASATRRYTRG